MVAAVSSPVVAITMTSPFFAKSSIAIAARLSIGPQYAVMALPLKFMVGSRGLMA